MDALVTAAARCLAAGDALGALQRVALRDDPPALAMRGIAMAQLGEHPRARELLRRAAKAFGPKEAVARARCVVAEAEVALALRDLADPPRPLLQAAAILDAHDDRANALLARWIAARRLILLGRLDDAASALPEAAPSPSSPLPALLVAMAELTRAELAWRFLRSEAAHGALDRATIAARRSGVPALIAEAESLRETMAQPVAHRLDAAEREPLRLPEVEALLRSSAIVVDACRRAVRGGGIAVDLARRPVLFSLARLLAEAGPEGVDRDQMILRVFRIRHADETHRARLRVELGRLRALLGPMARIEANSRGYALLAAPGIPITVLAPPIEGESAALLALLADGTAWSTSALALATGASQRTVQRALSELEAEGRVRAQGQARARRWLAPPLTGFATILLLPALPPSG